MILLDAAAAATADPLAMKVALINGAIISTVTAVVIALKKGKAPAEEEHEGKAVLSAVFPTAREIADALIDQLRTRLPFLVDGQLTGDPKAAIRHAPEAVLKIVGELPSGEDGLDKRMGNVLVMLGYLHSREKARQDAEELTRKAQELREREDRRTDPGMSATRRRPRKDES